MSRRLLLRREALAELSGADLQRVHGGFESGVTCYGGITGCAACDDVNWLLHSGLCPTTS